MDPARVNTSEPNSVIVDPISQIPDPIAESRRIEKPRRKRAVESTLVLRSRQLDELRAEVRRQYAAFRFRRLGSLAIWAALGGAAVLLGAFLARGFESEEPAVDSAAVAPLASSPVPAVASNGTATASPERPASAAALSATSAPTAASAATAAPAPPLVKGAASTKTKTTASKRILSLDELPTR